MSRQQKFKNSKSTIKKKLLLNIFYLPSTVMPLETRCQLKSFQCFQLNKILIYFLNFFIVKRKPQTNNRSRSRSIFQRTTYSYLRWNCWGVRHPCDRWGLTWNSLKFLKKIISISSMGCKRIIRSLDYLDLGQGIPFLLFFGLSLIPFSEQKKFFGNAGMLLGFVCHSFKVSSNVMCHRAS